MALGIEQNSIAPQLIQNSGQALVQGIRQIGQQISGHLTEMQTKRDLAALAQETQGLNVESADFPVQLTQLVSRHPMAVRDERGQMALSILGKAHGAWQASQADALAFQRQMKMLETRGAQARSQFEYEEAARGKRPMSVPGVGLVQPGEIDEVTGQPKVLVPAAPRPGSNRPTVLAPGAKAIDASGKTIAENPRLTLPTASEARLAKKGKIDLLMRQDAAAREEFGRLERRRDALSKQRMELNADDANIPYLDNTVKAIEEEAKALRQRRLDIQKAIEAIEIIPAEDQVEPELGVVPAGEAAGVLPEMGEIPTVMTVQEAKKLPKGTQFKSPDGKIRIAQ